jgi:hypothetical protein
VSIAIVGDLVCMVINVDDAVVQIDRSEAKRVSTALMQEADHVIHVTWPTFVMDVDMIERYVCGARNGSVVLVGTHDVFEYLENSDVLAIVSEWKAEEEAAGSGECPRVSLFGNKVFEFLKARNASKRDLSMSILAFRIVTSSSMKHSISFCNL